MMLFYLLMRSSLVYPNLGPVIRRNFDKTRVAVPGYVTSLTQIYILIEGVNRRLGIGNKGGCYTVATVSVLGGGEGDSAVWLPFGRYQLLQG